MRTELVTWSEVDKLVDNLLPQIGEEIDLIVAVNPGGLVLAGILAEALAVAQVVLAEVSFPGGPQLERAEDMRMAEWPAFPHFPQREIVTGRQVLVVDAAWASGRSMTAIKNRLVALGSQPACAVLHFNTDRNNFQTQAPDYYAAVTDAMILYPWQMNRRKDRISLIDFNW